MWIRPVSSSYSRHTPLLRTFQIFSNNINHVKLGKHHNFNTRSEVPFQHANRSLKQTFKVYVEKRLKFVQKLDTKGGR